MKRMDTSTSDSEAFSEDAGYLAGIYANMTDSIISEASSSFERDVAVYDDLSERAKRTIAYLRNEVRSLELIVDDLKLRIYEKDQHASLLTNVPPNRESTPPPNEDEEDQTADKDQNYPPNIMVYLRQANSYLYALLTNDIVHDQLVLQKVQAACNLFGTLSGSMEDDHATIELTFNRVCEIRKIVCNHYEDTSKLLAGVHSVYGMNIINSSDADIHEINRNNVVIFERVMEGYMEMDSRHAIEIECLKEKIDCFQTHCQFLSERKLFQQGQLKGMITMKKLLEITRPAAPAATST